MASASDFLSGAVAKPSAASFLGTAPSDDAPPQPTPVPADSVGVGGMNSLAKGLSFGATDYARALSNIGVPPGNPDDWSHDQEEQYGQAIAKIKANPQILKDSIHAIHQEDEGFSKEHPVVSTGAEIAGAVASPIAGAIGLPFKAAKAALPIAKVGAKAVAARLGLGAVEGATQGAAYGAGSSENPVEGAVTGAEIGGPLGFVAPAVSEIAGRTAKALTKAKLPEVPRSTVENAAKGNYDTVDNSIVRISPESFLDFTESLPSEMKGFKQGLPMTSTPKAATLVEKLQKFAAKNEDTLSVSDLDEMRQAINDARGTPDRGDASMLGKLVNKFDGYINDLTPDHLDVGESADLEKVQGAINDARKLWTRNAKMRDIESIVKTSADEDNPEKYIKQKFTALRRNKTQYARYTPDEKGIIKEIARTGTLDKVGLLAPDVSLYGGLSLLGHIAGATSTGGATLGLMVPGYIAKTAAARARQTALPRLQSLIAGGGTLPPAPAYVPGPTTLLAPRVGTIGGMPDENSP